MHSRRSLATFSLLTLFLSAVSAGDRITGPVDASRRAVLKGHIRPEVQPQNDQGLSDADTEIGYATLLMKLDPAVDTFLVAQQTPGSANFRRWLTPEQFGDRFGLTTNDMTKVVAWLESEGLKVNNVARGHHWVTFSGSAAKVGRALHTEIHNYMVKGERHFANATDPSIPEALLGVAGGFRGLNDFPAQSNAIKSRVQPTDPDFNLGSSHFLAPNDLATIYNIKSLYNAGIDGTGQTLVIAGQTALKMSDFTIFQTRFGLPANLPQVMLFGNDPGIRSGDLVEADLDLQWSTAVARNATIIYAYATNVFTAAQFAIDQNLGQQMSISYGGCEPYESVAFRAVAQQANAQGITMFVSSGDSGAATCDRFGPIDEATHGATASWPSSFPEITSVGGTEFNDAGGTFWATFNDSNGASALSYIPEVPWNDSTASHTLEGGGGAPSVLFAKPAWQTGPGVPNDGARDLPDVSLVASPQKYAYIIENNGNQVFVGGTSGSSPAWAGINALLNQYLMSKGVISQPGLGNINPSLYRLAQATTDVFHDITTGDNRVPCAQSTPDCVDGMLGFFAGAGYDLASGLGSVDVFNYVTEFASGTASTATVTATPATIAPADSTTLLAVVSGGGASPTGTVDFVTNDMNLGTATLTASGAGRSSATINVTGTQIAPGSGTITTLYSGDGVYTGANATTAVTIAIPTTGSYVVLWINPNPVNEVISGSWPYTLGLTEKNGVATTITGLTVNGVNNLGTLPTTALAANGTIKASLGGNNLAAPLNRVFVATGKDADGAVWTQSITVPFLAPAPGVTPLGPAMNVITTTPIVFQDPQADPSCAWSQQLTVQETGGYLMNLTSLVMGATSLASQLPVVFGTTRLAPYGILQGTLCLPNTTTPGIKTYTVVASIIDGGLGGSLSSTAVGTLVTSAPGAALQVSPASVTLSVTDGSPGASTTVNLSSPSAPWMAAVAPNNRTTKWLSLGKASGIGSVPIQASGAGLSSGVYNAIVVITSGQVPLNVPVTLIVNPSLISKIAAVVNNFSGTTTAAPGEMVAVFGTRMAPAVTPAVASRLPLPFSLNGVSATVNGVSAPMYYVSPTQIDLQIPYETGAGPAVLAINNNGNIAAFPLQVSATAPGVFNTPLDALTGVLSTTIAQNQFLVLYVTGEGDVTPTLTTGATPARQADPAKYPMPRQAVTVTIGGVPANVLFAGIPNGIATETQINIQVPANAPLGKQDLIVSVGGVASPPVSVTVTASP
jgi:uncharacterized protein (TIGR03437 family)